MTRPPLPHDFRRPVPAFTATSDSVTEGGTLLPSQTFEGGNLSPQPVWSDFPAATMSFAVTCFDPDAPTGSGWWHWVLVDIPADVTELPAGAGSGPLPGLPAGAVPACGDRAVNALTGWP